MLYVHDVQENANRAVTLTEAAELTLTETDRSPDGYRFQQGGGGGDVFIFPFFYDGGSSSEYEVVKDRSARKPVQLADTTRGQAQFIGWLAQE
jgi:hypothetical protein